MPAPLPVSRNVSPPMAMLAVTGSCHQGASRHSPGGEHERRFCARGRAGAELGTSGASGSGFTRTAHSSGSRFTRTTHSSASDAGSVFTRDKGGMFTSEHLAVGGDKEFVEDGVSGGGVEAGVADGDDSDGGDSNIGVPRDDKVSRGDTGS